jgi:hypothetical protein
MQIGPLLVYYSRRAEKDAAAQGISTQLQQTDFLLLPADAEQQPEACHFWHT